MGEPDYYELIGVGRDAPLQEIRTKFRQKVLAEHPDKGGDPKKFQLLNKAYSVLTDREKRQRYDTLGRADKSAEEEFLEGFGGGRHIAGQRPKDADAQAVVNLQDRIATQPDSHQSGFEEWLRGRDQQEMVLTDKDFMKQFLYNAAELATNIKHEGPVQHVLGSPSTSVTSQGQARPVSVEVKPRQLKKSIDHDELLVKMLAVPVDNSMVYAGIEQAGTCLGTTGIGRIEQAGSRLEEFSSSDTVLVLPKPTKFSPQRPIGTARTLITCNEEDVIKIPREIMEELTPEQLCLTPTIVSAYLLLEIYGSRLKPGDSILLNGAHLSAAGSSLLQLCRLLKLKPLCIVSLPGAKHQLVKGEYGSTSAWQDAEAVGSAPPTARAQYERISEWLLSMGAEEVFPDAVALLRWRNRNQRMLPKLALDGVATRDSCEQLIHCLQSGDKDAQLVVYGFGAAQPIEISPPLLAAWGGSLVGFNIARWVHALTANTKKMMSVMENVTKLVRANKFTLDTVVYKVGEDAVSEAFFRAAEKVENAQVVLAFPTLQEELNLVKLEQQRKQEELAAQQKRKLQETAAQQEAERKKQEADKKKQAEDDEIQRLRDDWLSMLFTSKSVAALSPEGPLPSKSQFGRTGSPQSLIVWIGDSPQSDSDLLKDLPNSFPSSVVVPLAWNEHSAGESLEELSLEGSNVLDGSWYLRDKAAFDNQDCDLLHDVELLGRSMVEAVHAKLDEYRLTWRNVLLAGFGKGAGIALYCYLMQLLPRPVSGLLLFNTVALVPRYIDEKIKTLDQQTTSTKVFMLWGSQDRAVPGNYRQLLSQTLRRIPYVQLTEDVMPQGGHSFDSRSYGAFESLLQLCLIRR
eukprot:TRINITY_DN64385_c0_g1_i1.p1 TRINITY_DN64385_c0_g1~~TRINITY_DN64385_c0_g1_i1.p1  ORF type:complete len:855 (-),score=157.39 TRINITY_DN64385_c0_g1_i1:54-2618(-)